MFGVKMPLCLWTLDQNIQSTCSTAFCVSASVAATLLQMVDGYCLNNEFKQINENCIFLLRAVDMKQCQIYLRIRNLHWLVHLLLVHLRPYKQFSDRYMWVFG